MVVPAAVKLLPLVPYIAQVIAADLPQPASGVAKHKGLLLTVNGEAADIVKAVIAFETAVVQIPEQRQIT